MFRIIVLLLVAASLSACATTLLAPVEKRISLGGGSSITFTKSGCSIGNAEFHNASNQTKSPAIGLVAANSEKRTIAEWAIFCTAAIGKGASTCDVNLKSGGGYFKLAGGVACPDLQDFTVSQVYGMQ